MFFYSLYTNWVLWGCSNIKLQACPLCGAGMEKYWKLWFIAQSAAESIQHHSQFFIPLTLFLFCGPKITGWEHLLSQTLVLGWLCFSFFPLVVCLLSFAWAPYLTSASCRSAVQISLLGVWDNSVLSVEGSGNDLIWRPDYLIFLPQACGCINPQGTEPRRQHWLIQLGVHSSLGKKYINK